MLTAPLNHLFGGQPAWIVERGAICINAASRITRRSGSIEAVEFFNVLNRVELLETTEASLPVHRERLYSPTTTLSMFMRQTLEVYVS